MNLFASLGAPLLTRRERIVRPPLHPNVCLTLRRLSQLTIWPRDLNHGVSLGEQRA